MLALAIGKFDALHRGHRALIERAARLGEPALLTFSGMAAVLGWRADWQPLVAPSDRARVLAGWSEQLGRPVRVLELPFADVQPLAATEFLAVVRDRLGAGAVVVGDDFRFGRGRAAGADDLPTLAAAAGLTHAVVPAVHEGGAAVSSSRVRAAVIAGDVALAARLLGRPYRHNGTIQRGDGRGRALGFPTANCGAPENLTPGGGVYAARAWIAGRGPWPAAVNAGHLPTIGDGRVFTVEAHLIGYDGDGYGAPIALDLVARLRDERRFASLDELKTQIARDVAAAAATAGI